MPSRRDVCASLSSLGLAGLAGCSGLLGGDGSDTTAPPETLTPLSTAVPPCPGDDMGDADTRVACESAFGASLSVTPERAELPRADLRVTLRNDGSGRLQLLPSQLVPFKHVGGDWYPIPLYPPVGGESGEVPPGGSTAWTVTVDNGRLSAPVERRRGRPSDVVRGLGAGGYAFVVLAEHVDAEGDGGSEAPGLNAMFFGRFALEGERLRVEPSSRVRRTDREDETMHVWAGSEGSRENRVVVEHEPDPEPGGARRRLVAESVFRAEPLRNTLPYVDDPVRKVVLRTGARFPPLLTEPVVFFQGEAYRYRVEER